MESGVKQHHLFFLFFLLLPTQQSLPRAFVSHSLRRALSPTPLLLAQGRNVQRPRRPFPSTLSALSSSRHPPPSSRRRLSSRLCCPRRCRRRLYIFYKRSPRQPCCRRAWRCHLVLIVFFGTCRPSLSLFISFPSADAPAATSPHDTPRGCLRTLPTSALPLCASLWLLSSLHTTRRSFGAVVVSFVPANLPPFGGAASTETLAPRAPWGRFSPSAQLSVSAVLLPVVPPNPFGLVPPSLLSAFLRGAPPHPFSFSVSPPWPQTRARRRSASSKSSVICAGTRPQCARRGQSMTTPFTGRRPSSAPRTLRLRCEEKMEIKKARKGRGRGGDQVVRKRRAAAAPGGVGPVAPRAQPSRPQIVCVAEHGLMISGSRLPMPVALRAYTTKSQPTHRGRAPHAASSAGMKNDRPECGLHSRCDPARPVPFRSLLRTHCHYFLSPKISRAASFSSTFAFHQIIPSR